MHNAFIRVCVYIAFLLLLVGGVLGAVLLCRCLLNLNTLKFLFGPDEDEPPPNPPENYR